MRDPRPLVRRFNISAAVSISSCPVRNTKISPGTEFEEEKENKMRRKLRGKKVGGEKEGGIGVEEERGERGRKSENKRERGRGNSFQRKQQIITIKY